MLQKSVIQSFIEKLDGPVILPGDSDYDENRALWNAMLDKRPTLIARCHSAADVTASVNLAREQGLPVAVRGGGHNVAGLASVDDGLMIDLSPMNAVHVDPVACTAHVHGGAIWGDVDRRTQEFSLATPSGIISTTGVGGLTLGGGFGWLSRKYGLTSDNVLSADVVTADGELRKADPEQNSDLFWAIRGGGGNFGVITSFEFRLHRVGPEVLFGPTVYRLEDAAEVLRHYRDFSREAPNECTVYADFLTAPPLPFLPEEVHGTTVLFLIQLHAGEAETGETTLRPLRRFGNPVADAVAPTSYAEAQSRSDPLFPKGGRYYWKSHNFAALTDNTIDALVGSAAAMPTPQCDILIQQQGGRIGDLAPDATAYRHRDTGFVVTLGGRSDQPEQDGECIAWAREAHAALDEHADAGVYVNFLGHDESEERQRAAYGENTGRLRKIKAKYDPGNFFQVNHNIEPAGGSR